MTTPEKVDFRIHGSAALPTLIYLPGLHGDWTLIGGFRMALRGRVRFVEVTYPRTLTWSLDGYASGVERALETVGIRAGWLLGESFGSQVVWAMAARGSFPIEAIVLAGGFARHPIPAAARLARGLVRSVPIKWIGPMLGIYAGVTRMRYRRSPQVRRGLDEFLARRTLLDKQAAEHRLRLVAQNDPGPTARRCSVPVYAMTGALDPIVPWSLVERWLRTNCPALRQYKVIWRADHNVLGTAPERAAEQVLKWMMAASS